jgi:Flp pilus assembly protein TadD
MNAAHPNASLRHATIIISMALGEFLLPAHAAAQARTNDSMEGRRPTGALEVSVRDERGALLATSAVVRLSSADDVPTGQVAATSGGQVTFHNLTPGNYSIDVQASGYTKGHAEIRVTIYGATEMEIELHESPSANSLNIAPGSGEFLAPKAKKELELGLEALQKKDLIEAQRHLEKAGHLAPMHSEVLYLLGTLNMQMGDLVRSEDLLGKAIQMNAQHARAHETLGILLSNERRFDEAVTPLQKALELNPRSWEARWALAGCYYNQRQFQRALEQSRQALNDSNGDTPAIALLLAESLTAREQYEESAAVLRKVILEHGDRPEAARARRWLDRLQKAGKIKPI